MWNKVKLKSGVLIGIIILIIFIMIGFVEKKQQIKAIGQIDINIENQFDNYFIDEKDIEKLVSNNNTLTIIGAPFESYDLKEIEKRIKTNPFVKTAEVFKDLKGNLIVNIKQRKPIARIIASRGPDAYISSDGLLMPISDKYTARVLLISGEKTKTLINDDLIHSEFGNQLVRMITFIENDKFWKAQVAQLHMDERGEIILYPQIGKQYVEFGKPDNYMEKFKKLKIFFKRILPQKGWNHYKKVNIKYNNQIICE